MINEVIITVGIPASGKSTWAREYVKENPNTVITCRDDIRAAHGWTEYGNHAVEQRITKIQRSQIEAALLEGMDVIVADTNIQPKFRNQLVKFAHQHGADAVIKVFPIPLDEAIWRDCQRKDKAVGFDVIGRMYQQLESQNVQDEVLPVPTYEPYVHATEGRKTIPAIIVDIDGTVARHVARSPYDYSKVGTDEPIEDVLETVNLVKQMGVRLVFVSGREDSCFDDTHAWLVKHLGHGQFNLLMRKTGDQRPDWIIKNEIYDAKVIPNFKILMVFDDRDQVVTHLRRRGITVAQVAPGRF
jgi:predicted kinase